MALLTTTPARLITPTPVITTTNGMRNTVSPSNTPTVDSTTELMMMIGLVTESNCEIRMKAMRKAASRKATNRKSCDSCCSCC